MTMTRLGFGVNSVPKIIVTELKAMVRKVERIRKATTNSYINEFLVDEAVVSATEVGSNLRQFRLIVKPPEPIIEGASKR